MAWIFASCKCCVLSGRGLCVGLIPRPEESYRVCVCPSVIMDKEKYSLRCKSGRGILTVRTSSTLYQLQFILYPSCSLSKESCPSPSTLFCLIHTLFPMCVTFEAFTAYFRIFSTSRTVRGETTGSKSSMCVCVCVCVCACVRARV